MSIPTLDGETSAPAQRHRSELPEPADRGTLEIHPSVLQKLVQRIVDDAPDTMRTRGRLGGEHGATAKVTGESEEVDIAVVMALRYPMSVAQAAARVKEKVIDEVRRITGYRVRTVDMTVSALLPENRAPRVE